MAPLAVPAGQRELLAPVHLEGVSQLDDGHGVHLLVSDLLPGGRREDEAAAQVFP